MGFSLVKTIIGPVPGSPDGWARHVFYDTGSQGMIAFWDIHDVQWKDGYPTDINKLAGLPGWVNHFAYFAGSREFLDERRKNWTAHGHMVAEVDHEFCVSIYTADPDGNTVEFCFDTREFTDEEKVEAMTLMLAEKPPMDKDAKVTIHPPTNEALVH
jgi:catechol 2,3-dioxygenase-like lactoylglutathione lyase family enzyme